MEGWVKLHRVLLENPLWTDKPFSSGQAWVDLLLRANHKDNSFIYKNNMHHVNRGEILVSFRSLEKRWGWSKGKCDRFLKLLIFEKMVTLNGTPNGTLITICNYDKYQSKNDSDGTPNGTPNGTLTGHQRDTDGTLTGRNNNIKNVKNEKNVKKTTLLEPDVSSCDVKPKRKKKETDPRLHTIITYFFDKHLEKTGEKYHVLGGKDGNIIKGLLGTYGEDKLKSLIDGFFASKDEYVINGGYSIGMLNYKLPKIIKEQKEKPKAW